MQFDRQRAAGPHGRQELGGRQRRVGAQPVGQRRHALHGFHDFGEQQGARHQRLAGEVAGEDQPAHQRGNNIVLPFLGQPACFNDGPFRLAALLRRKVFFMAGLYGGGARYDVQFDALADFGEPVSGLAQREERIRAALEAYVARLEALCRAHPYNWFNFHDFWLEDAA